MLADLPWILAAAFFGIAASACLGYVLAERARTRLETELEQWRTGKRVRVLAGPMGWVTVVDPAVSGDRGKRPADPARSAVHVGDAQMRAAEDLAVTGGADGRH